MISFFQWKQLKYGISLWQQNDPASHSYWHLLKLHLNYFTFSISTLFLIDFWKKISKHLVKIVLDQNFKCDFINILTPLCRPLVNILTSKVDNIRCARSFSTPFWGAAQLVGSVLFLVKPGSTGLAIVKFFKDFSKISLLL